MVTGLVDMNNEKLYDGDVIESVDYGTKLKICYDDETSQFGGKYFPTKSKPRGWGVNDIRVLALDKYFKVEVC